MALNPFFLQGSQTEQRLVQSLINEQLQIYGVEVTYIPRKFVNKETVLNEIQSSKFDDNFLIEAYVNTYEGYSGQGDIMTKFGVSLRDEVTLTISQERFLDFIAPFMEAVPDSEISLITRPREGDLVFFPLGNRLFEVKFVEHENPFYQVGKLFTFKMQCELFEYSGEDFDTGSNLIDQIEDEQAYQIGLTLANTYSGGDGAYYVNEDVSVTIDGTATVVGEVVSWSPQTRKLMIKDNTRTLQVGDTVTGANGTAREILSIDDVMTMAQDPQADNKDFETTADNYLDFSETNPFGEVT